MVRQKERERRMTATKLKKILKRTKKIKRKQREEKGDQKG